MLFSSISFIYYFLPVVFAVYFGLPRACRNAVLFAASFVFYFYGEPRYIFLMLFSAAVDYAVGLAIDRFRGRPAARYALLCSVAVNMSLLLFFKYADFIIANANTVFGLALPMLRIPLPLGISFYTFQTMSYSIDVYRGDAKTQKNPLDFATYVALFPQLVAGPIVRYQTVADEMTGRRHSVADFAAGAQRFIIGLGKKVIIANTLGELDGIAFATRQPSVLFAWLGMVAFMLQIYFDFSGYSDMAIGLGRIFGFHFLENFNYPFIADSLSEFWRRWHISMGTWFREYVYIPLGGNRVSRLKWFRNLAVVWFCTGFWHGAAWNFVCWGLYFGALLALEKLVLQRVLTALPRAVRHLYVLLAVTVSFVIFHLESYSAIVGCLAELSGLSGLPLVNAESLYYLRSYGVLLVAAAVGATPAACRAVEALRANPRLQRAVDLLAPFALEGLLVVCTAYLVDSSFNPFLYFRF